MSSLEQLAIDAVGLYPDSHAEMAMEFASKACPAFAVQDNDRLVKMGRSLENLVFLKDKIPMQASVEQLVEECTLLCSGQVKVSVNSLDSSVVLRLLFISYITSLLHQ